MKTVRLLPLAASSATLFTTLLGAPAAHGDTWSSGTGTIFSGSSTKVGVGVSAPATQLDVSANTSGRVSLRVNQAQSNANIAEFRQNGTTRVTVTPTGVLQCNNGLAASINSSSTAAISATATNTGTSAVGLSATSPNGTGVFGSTTTGKGVYGSAGDG